MAPMSQAFAILENRVDAAVESIGAMRAEIAHLRELLEASEAQRVRLEEQAEHWNIAREEMASELRRALAEIDELGKG